VKSDCRNDLLKLTKWDPSLHTAVPIIWLHKSRSVRWVEYVARTREMYIDFSLVIDDVKGPLRILWCGWKVNIRMSAEVTRLECVD